MCIFSFEGKFMNRSILNQKFDSRVGYRKNESLITVLESYRGNPFLEKRFLNEQKKKNVPLSSLIKWVMSKSPDRCEKKADTYKLKVKKIDSLDSVKGDSIIWLGHSAFIINLGGVRILTDPCLTSPILRKRLSPLPITINGIRDIDCLLISHSHRDHLDAASLRKLDLSGTHALLPLGMGKIVKRYNKDIKIQEAGWYQKFELPFDNIEIFLLPAQHWSNRHLFGDTNRVLWGSYIIRTPEKIIYFTGDSAYAGHFSRIGELFGNIDICLMPIGAYKPDYIMKQNHVSPREAVQAFHDLNGKEFIPMHYGTFDLSDEPFGEPLRLIREMKKEKAIDGKLTVLDVGQAYRI